MRNKYTKATSSIKDKATYISIFLFIIAFFSYPVCAQQAFRTSGASLDAPIANTIDQNGVDLLTGKLNVKSPGLSGGDKAHAANFYLTWNGRQWLPNTPSLWLDSKEWHVYVRTAEGTDEFANAVQSSDAAGTYYTYTQIRPNTGATLKCYGTGGITGQGWFENCRYVSRRGRIVYFGGLTPYNGGFPTAAQYDYEAYGNAYNYPQREYVPDKGYTYYQLDFHDDASNDAGAFGYTTFYSNGGDIQVRYPNGYYVKKNGAYNNPTISFIIKRCKFCNDTALSTLSINTPNLSTSDQANSYLHPKNTTQAFTDPAGAIWRYTFDGNGDMTKITSPSGHVDTITYSSHMVATFNDGNATWHYSYNFGDTSTGAGTTTATAPDGGVTTVAHDRKPGPPTIITITVGSVARTTHYYYDGADRVTKIIYPGGNYDIYDYNAYGNVKTLTHYPKSGATEQPLVTTATYTGAGTLPDTITDSNGNTTSYTYSFNRPATITEPPVNGISQVTTYTYGSQPIYYVDTSGSVQQQYHSLPVLMAVSQCRTSTNCEGSSDETKTILGYSTGYLADTSASNGSPITSTVELGDASKVRTTTLTYDAIGNEISSDGPIAGSADTSVMKYDADRRKIGDISPDPDGSGGSLVPLATRTAYNGEGQVTAVESGTVPDQSASAWNNFTSRKKTLTYYDVTGRKQFVRVNGSDNVTVSVTQYSYDPVGRVKCTAVRMRPVVNSSLPSSACSQDPYSTVPDRITENVYDVAGELLQIRKGVGTSLDQAYATYTYTINGKQELVIDANGNRAEMVYDGFDRLRRWYFPSQTKPSAYNDSTPATAQSTSGVIDPGDYEEYGYDANGNRTSLRKRDGTIIDYQYDGLNRNFYKHVDAATTSLPASQRRDVYYNYDLLGHQTYARFDSPTGEGVTNTWDGFGEQTSSTINMDGVSRSLTYSYDADGNRKSMAYPDQNEIDYSYDNADRLSSVAINESSQLFYPAYNADGTVSNLYRWPIYGSNWSSDAMTGYGYDPAQRLKTITIGLMGSSYDTTTTFERNAASQITSATRTNDAFTWTAGQDTDVNFTTNGLNQYSTVGAHSFGYDLNGNLTSDGTATYAYDAENRLISRTGSSSTAVLRYDPLGRLYEVIGTTSGATTSATRFLYDGDALVAEYNTAGTLLRRYVHGTDAGDDPLVWFEGAGVTPSTRHYLFADERGSIVAITDGYGYELAVNAYDEYGVPDDVAAMDSPSVISTKGRFRYTGQTLIPELGMYYYKARMYSPSLGRFMQTDPIGYKDQINLYAYVGNDPVNAMDPSGTDGVWSDIFSWAGEQGRYIQGQIAQIPFDLRDLADHIKDGTTGLPPTLGGNPVSELNAIGELGSTLRTSTRGLGLITLRRAYIAGARSLGPTSRAMLAAGRSEEAVARWAVSARNSLKVFTRLFSPADEVAKMEARNLVKYGDKIGPTAEQMLERYGSWRGVIDASTRTDGLIPDGF